MGGSLLDLAYQVYPAGPAVRSPIVLLHALGSCADDWQLQLPALAGRWPTLAVDLRGHGDSPSASGWYGMTDIAADVAALLDRSAIGPGHVVGLSLGAAAGLQLAVDRPDLVLSLVLVNGFAGLRLGWRGAAGGAVRLALLLAGRMDWLGRWVAATVFPHPGQAQLRRLAANRIGRMQRADYLRTLWALARFDVHDQLGQVSVPTLVVAALQDRTVPFDAKRRLASGLPWAEWAVLPGSGHASPIDAPDAFNPLLTAFLLRQRSASPDGGRLFESKGPLPGAAGGPSSIPRR